MAMATKSLILVANPGGASRKYALYEGERCRVQLHFEYDKTRVICTVTQDGKEQVIPTAISDISNSLQLVPALFQDRHLLSKDEHISCIGLRIVAPSSFFMEDRRLTTTVIAKLDELRARAPLHIEASLRELHALRLQFRETPLFGVSDSAFHRTKPVYAQNYGLPLPAATKLDIKRFGYHGLAVASAVHQLRATEKLTPRVVIVHLGSGASVTALHNGRSIDNTMGYSPLEGPIMATRSGSIDITATQVLKKELGLNDRRLDEYLNKSSGLLGLGGSDDIRELIQRQSTGNQRAKLALNTYVYNVQKAIGAMIAALGGVDQLVFTGTVGERSVPIRTHVVKAFNFFDFMLDENTNSRCVNPNQPTLISRLTYSKPIYVVPVDEGVEIVKRIHALFSSVH